MYRQASKLHTLLNTELQSRANVNGAAFCEVCSCLGAHTCSEERHSRRRSAFETLLAAAENGMPEAVRAMKSLNVPQLLSLMERYTVDGSMLTPAVRTTSVIIADAPVTPAVSKVTPMVIDASAPPVSQQVAVAPSAPVELRQPERQDMQDEDWAVYGDRGYVDDGVDVDEVGDAAPSPAELLQDERACTRKRSRLGSSASSSRNDEHQPPPEQKIGKVVAAESRVGELQQCRHCAESILLSNMSRHVKTMHPESAIASLMQHYRCEYPGCDENFMRKDYLQKHLRTHDFSLFKMVRIPAGLDTQNVIWWGLVNTTNGGAANRTHVSQFADPDHPAASSRFICVHSTCWAKRSFQSASDLKSSGEFKPSK
jgi:hypothetical protein